MQTPTQAPAEKKTTFKRVRDGLQQGIYAVINPFVKLLIRMGVTPNMVTAIGLLGTAVSSGLVFYAGWKAQGGAPVDYALLLWAGIVSIAFSLFDMLDGQVARLGGMESKFGAFYDSVLDRYSEFMTLGSLIFYFIFTGAAEASFVTFLALMGSLMVSYIRARGEALGTCAKVGLMQRPERVVVTAVALIAAGWTGMACECFRVPYIILISAMGLIAVLANYTALRRLGYCKGTL